MAAANGGLWPDSVKHVLREQFIHFSNGDYDPYTQFPDRQSEAQKSEVMS